MSLAEPTPLEVHSRRANRSRGLPQWMRLGDFAAEVVVYLLLAVGLLHQGFASVDEFRTIAWAGCGLLGLWAAAGLALDRWRGSHLRTARWVLAGLGAMVLWTGVQLIPLPFGLVTAVSPLWGEIQQTFQAVGLDSPARAPLAVNLDRALWSWDQLLASTLFFAGVALLATRRSCSVRLIAAVALVASIEGIWGFFRYASGSQPHAIGALFNPSHHAALVIAGMPLFLVWAFDLSRRSEYFSGSLLSGSNPLLLLLGAGILALLGWALSFSRGGLVLGGGTLVLWTGLEIWGARRDSSTEQGGPAFPLTASGVGGSIVLLLALAGLVYSASLMEGIASLQWETGERQGLGRFELWRATLQGLGDSPWVGVGLGGTENALTRYSMMIMRTDPIWSHNDYVQILAELGLPVALVVGGSFCFALRSFWGDTRQRWSAFDWSDRIMTRAALAGLIAVLLHAGVDFHLRIPLVGFVTLILLALSINDGPLFVANDSSGRR